MQSDTEEPHITDNCLSTKIENFEMCNDGTPDESTRKWNNLHTLAGLYALFLVVVAAISVFTENLNGPVPLFHIHVYFYFYLLLLSIIFFVLNFIRKCDERIQVNCEISTIEENNCCLYNIRYFHIGILVSGLAAFICACLKTAATFATPEKCINSFASALLILHCIFIVMQIIFFFFNVNKLFRVFGCMNEVVIMHLAATNAALWFYMALWEGSRDWQEAKHQKHNSSLKWGKGDMNITIHSIEYDLESSDSRNHFPKHAVHVTSNCWWRVPDTEMFEDIISIQLCLQNSTLGFIWKKSSEILYPIIMQYYLIATFLLCIVWESTKTKCKTRHASVFKIQFQNTGFCYNSCKGFLIGFVCLIISLIVAFSMVGKHNFYIICTFILCFLFGSAIIASVIGLIYMRPISTNIIPMNQNFFHSYQQIGIVVIYIYGVLNIISGTFSDYKYNSLLSIIALLMILHAISQYFFIIHLSTSSINSKAGVKSKQLISFLVLCNATLWIIESFLYWSSNEIYPQYTVYGSDIWQIFMKFILPCLVFYRFNSAIILLENLRYSRDVSFKETF